MELVWQSKAWDDYLYWQQTDKKVLQRINDLIKDCLLTLFKGIGKPEPLKGNFAGNWSRRVTDEHRLIYCVEGWQVAYFAMPVSLKIKITIIKHVQSWHKRMKKN